MKPLFYMTANAILASVYQQILLQQQLIEAQQEIIRLQRQIEKMTPKNPKDKDVFWHMVSDGLSSAEAATSDDPVTLRQFRDWNLQLAKKHVKPYVNPKVYGEVVNQMTRGLPDRIADSEARKEAEVRDIGHLPKVSLRSTR